MSTLLTLCLAFLGWLTAVYLQPRRHLGYIFLIILRVGALALSPLLTLLGLLLGWRHWRRGNRWLLLPTTFATAVLTLVTYRQTTPTIDSYRLPPPPRPARRLRPFLTMPVPFAQNKAITPDLRADLWAPPADVMPSGVGIINLHPSAWHYLKKDLLHGTRTLFSHWVQQGHVVLDLDYTLAPEAAIPDMLAEVKKAVRWLKTEGRAYGVQPEKVVVMGGSAGGYLAQLTAYTGVDSAEDTAVAGVISFYGVSDLAALQTHLDAFPPIPDVFAPPLRWLGLLPNHGHIVNTGVMIPSFLGCQPQETTVYRQYSPIHHVGPHCPPTLLLHGRHDFGAPITQSRNLFLALRRAGVPVQLVEFPFVDHMFDVILPQTTPAMNTAVACLDHFLYTLFSTDFSRYGK